MQILACDGLALAFCALPAWSSWRDYCHHHRCPGSPALLWMIPLVLYLLSFVLVFARRQIVSPAIFDQRLPILILCGLVPGHAPVEAEALIGPAHPLFDSSIQRSCMVCFTENLPQPPKPPALGLTEFYLLISVGGALGGIFNSIIAPIAFHSVVEFPIALICAALLRRSNHQNPLNASDETRAQRLDWFLLPLALGVGTDCRVPHSARCANASPSSPCTFSSSASRWPAACSSPSGGLFGLDWALPPHFSPVSSTSGPTDTFSRWSAVSLASIVVADDPTGRFRNLLHGATQHGMQKSSIQQRAECRSQYYTVGGPAGPGSPLRQQDRSSAVTTGRLSVWEQARR